MAISHPGRGPHRPVTVDARRLAELRTAVSVLRDPLAGPAALERACFRMLPQQPRAGGASATRGPARSTGMLTGTPPAAEVAAPEGEQATVMAIVGRAQAGDAEAFGELYDRYVDLVYRYIYYRVGTHALAEDLASETFLRALRRISSYTWQGRDFGAWLVTIARNLVADHYKSGRYRLEVATADMLEAGADRSEDGPEGEVLDGITNATLLDAVKQLNAEQQECIVLRFLEGLSVAETAAAMGKNEGAIKALQYRAVRALGRLLPTDLRG